MLEKAHLLWGLTVIREICFIGIPPTLDGRRDVSAPIFTNLLLFQPRGCHSTPSLLCADSILCETPFSDHTGQVLQKTKTTGRSVCDQNEQLVLVVG